MTSARLLAATWALLSLATISPAQENSESRPTFIAGPDGAIYFWRPGDAALGPLPPSLARLGSGPVHALGLSGDGSTLIALPAAQGGGKPGRGRHEGSAVVVSIPPAGGQPSIPREIHFDGDGQIVTLSVDGLEAYVLSTRPGPDTSPGSTRIWLHALDVESGRVEGSAVLESIPATICLDPKGDRLYLGFANRIVSYTTRPLVRSWHYRSPGNNAGVAFGPRGGLLYAVRDKHLALFDAASIAARKPEERQRREDDATALVPLPFSADGLLFSRDGRLGAAYGSGNGLVFFDPESMRVFSAPEGAAVEPGRQVLPIAFDALEDSLAVAVFPDRSVRLVHPPAAALEQKAPPPPQSTPPPPPVEPQPTASPIPKPTPEATPPPQPTPPPEAPQPESTPGPSPSSEAILAGRLTGRSGMVQVIVIYGPGSIVHEQARAIPDSSGLWLVPLPPPGIYRIVPLGEGSRPVRTDPHFLTVQVKGQQGVTDLDFSVLGTN